MPDLRYGPFWFKSRPGASQATYQATWGDMCPVIIRWNWVGWQAGGSLAPPKRLFQDALSDWLLEYQWSVQQQIQVCQARLLFGLQTDVCDSMYPLRGGVGLNRARRILEDLESLQRHQAWAYQARVAMGQLDGPVIGSLLEAIAYESAT
jgi:hypothetical protein